MVPSERRIRASSLHCLRHFGLTWMVLVPRCHSGLVVDLGQFDCATVAARRANVGEPFKLVLLERIFPVALIHFGEIRNTDLENLHGQGPEHCSITHWVSALQCRTAMRTAVSYLIER